ncbi:peptidase domain-containing ABC transporter [Lacipirellula limnantheis]|uniref:Beta-(1-->2)glucan export ATP-binding/permease protein NdvA n=1 Tax=Lacipirellula limnantheis TaxID=2528024 RepID=A0A517TVD1_9BACT|nr:ATP-binding cassette domain-containing protein [Lacipirellula limnantheis]QDT72333.1 Beta-(1-->2)glucan export ATP-binding/permease protein NdvA [Lacipirellula limnantheis]
MIEESQRLSSAGARSSTAVARTTDPRLDADHRELATFLDLAAHEMGVSFDRVEARRHFGEWSRDSGAGNSLSDLHAMLSASASGFRLRVDLLPLALDEAAGMIRPQAPLGLLRRNDDGSLGWTLLADYRGFRVKVFDSALGSEAKWMSLRRLGKRIGDAPPVREWIALQPLLLCSPPSSAHEHPTPLSRLLTLLAPDRSDIGVILIFAVVIGLLALSSPIAVEALVNTVAFGQFVQPVIVLAGILGVFLGFAAAMRAVQAYIAEIIQRRLFVRIAGDLAHRLPRVGSKFWDNHYGPELTNRFFEVVTVQKVTTQLLLEGSALLLQTLVGMAVIAFYHPVLLGFDAFLLLFIFGIIFLMGRGAVDTSVNESRQKYATAAWFEDLARFSNLFGSRSAAAFAVEQTDRRVAEYLTARIDHFRILMRQVIASLALQVVASTVLLGLGGWLVIRGELSLGQLVAAELIVTVIVGSFAKIGKFLEGYYDVMASMDKLGHLFDLPTERLDGIEMAVGREGVAVKLRDVTTPPTACGARLDKASCAIDPGTMVAVVGGSAAQRRQFLEVLIRDVDPLEGCIELDGLDARRVSIESLRDQASLVGDAEIFHGSVTQNVHVGRSTVGEAEVAAALQAVDLLDEMLSLREGLDYRLETEGNILSLDQKVRMTLARALAGRPRMLLIDHALDGLPDDIIGRVFGSLKALDGNCTLIIATGRRDVLLACDAALTIGRDGKVNSSPVQLPHQDSPRLLTKQV